jgi:DNA topoisomerase-1
MKEIKRLGNYKIGFKYIQDGKKITDKKELERIKSLKIPPAYNDVIITCGKKVIAYGYDTKGRKQVIYSQEFIKRQTDKKYINVVKVAKIFPKIQNILRKDILSANAKKREIAMIVSLILECGFRIGNKKYEDENKSYGLTTIKFGHMSFKSGCININFIGKKGVVNDSICKNIKIFNYLKAKYDRLGSKASKANVFSYLNDDKKRCHITSIDVNKYLNKIDKDITSKVLRTLNANYLFLKFINFTKVKTDKNPIKLAIEMVSTELHNTPAICKKSYIDPKMIKYAEMQIQKNKK